MSHAPTDEQTSILDLGRTSASNLMISALAGTGKTSTLEMLEDAVPEKPILYLVFNKRNADEASERMASTTTVRTFNGLGHRIWASAISSGLRLDTKKTYNVFKEIADDAPQSERGTIWATYDEVRRGVEMATALGYVPYGCYPNATRLTSASAFHSHLDETPDELVSGLIDAVLRRRIKLSYEGLIDYNDQIYMPALFGGTYPKFPLTLVDEYQDLNPTNHEMIRKLTGGGKRRLIGVGDKHQSIYAFRGANASGMSQAISKYDMQGSGLSISFRCPSAIVRNAHWLVPHFRWSREGGEVAVRDHMRSSEIEPSSIFICRNNAPLFALAFKLIANGHGITLAGSEIGPRLVKTMQKLSSDNPSRDTVLGLIDEWEQAKLAKESKSASDMAECMRIIASHGTDLSQAVAYAEHLFKQRGQIQLMTGHKSKGLEFPLVYHLDPHILKDGGQDRNIRYVIQTRSSDRYYEVDSSTIQWDSK